MHLATAKIKSDVQKFLKQNWRQISHHPDDGGSKDL
jgi:hypothetical protein